MGLDYFDCDDCGKTFCDLTYVDPIDGICLTCEKDLIYCELCCDALFDSLDNFEIDCCVKCEENKKIGEIYKRIEENHRNVLLEIPDLIKTSPKKILLLEIENIILDLKSLQMKLKLII